MRRSAARCRMASRSPGRRRMVIRSRAGPLLDGLGGKSGAWESSNARMAISASVDSDTCRWAATALLLRRRTRRDRRPSRFRGAVVHCSPICVAANRGHFAILSSLQYRPDNSPRSKIFAHFRSADTDLYIARITESLWGGFRGIFGGTLPGSVQAQVCSIEYTARSLIVLRFTCG
jgi:hypothetical protein